MKLSPIAVMIEEAGYDYAVAPVPDIARSYVTKIFD